MTGNTKLVELLIENGANVNAVENESKLTPLHLIAAVNILFGNGDDNEYRSSNWNFNFTLWASIAEKKFHREESDTLLARQKIHFAREFFSPSEKESLQIFCSLFTGKMIGDLGVYSSHCVDSLFHLVKKSPRGFQWECQVCSLPFPFEILKFKSSFPVRGFWILSIFSR